MKLTQVTNYLGITNMKDEPEQVLAEVEKTDPRLLGEKEVLMTWDSLSRPERKIVNNKFARTGIIIGIVVALLLVLMQEFFLILSVASIIFISYILSSTPIEKVQNEISTHGIKTGTQSYYWTELKQFFVSRTTGTEMIAIDTKNMFPGRIYLSFLPNEKDKIIENVSKYIPYLDQEPLTVFDKTYFRVLDKINFDRK